MKRYGYTERIRSYSPEFLRRAEATYANRNDLTGRQYVSKPAWRITREKYRFMAIAETQYNLDKQYLEALTFDDVNAWVKQLSDT